MYDLHMHTTASDGTLSPAELLTECEKLGLELIAITDHNRLEAYDDLRKPEIRRLFSGEILTGCEISTHLQGMGIEILAFGADPDALRKAVAEYFPPEQTRLKRMLSILKAICTYRARGFTMNEDRILESQVGIHNIARVLWLEINQYPENRAHYIYPESEWDFGHFFRWEYGNIESPFFHSIAEFRPDPKTICEMIHSLGGKAIIAHPATYTPWVYQRLEGLIQEAKPDGLEAWYGSHTPEQREHLLGLCKKYNLIYSGGSDFHRPVPDGNLRRLGIPALKEIYPTDEIYGWAKTLRMV